MTGIAPLPAQVVEGPTAYCRHCATLIRWWPDTPWGDVPVGAGAGDLVFQMGEWRHCSLDAGSHTAEPMPEGEARAMDGNR